MELQCRKKTYDAVGDDPGSLGQAVRWREFGVGELVEASTPLNQEPLFLHPLQIDPGDPDGVKIAGTGDPPLPNEGKGASLQLRRASRHVTYTRRILTLIL